MVELAKIRVGILVDTNPISGLGHINRCLGIAEGFKENGVEAIFIINNLYPSINIIDSGFKVIQSEIVCNILVYKVINQKIQIIIIDSYSLNKDFFIELRDKIPEVIILLIDDDGSRADYPVDGFINFNLGAEASLYPLALQQYSVIGPEFYPLRRGITDIKPRKVDLLEKRPQKFLLTLGASDPEDQTRRLVNILRSLEEIKEIKVIVGKGYKFLGELMAETNNDARCHIIYNPQNMAEMLAESELAITAGGVTLIELLYYKVPVFIISLAENQIKPAVKVQESGCGFYIGHYSKLTNEEIKEKITEYYKNIEKIKLVIRTSKCLIDGNGRERLSKIILNISNTYHQDCFDINEVMEEYEESSSAEAEYAKVKWGSEQGLLYRCQLALELIDWTSVNSWCDVGCGTGLLLQEAAAEKDFSGNYIGIDLSVSLLKLARDRLPEQVLGLFCCGDFSQIRFKENFDLVTCIGVLQKCGVSLRKAIKILASFLKPGGQLFLTTKNLDWQEFRKPGFAPYPGHHWFKLADLENAIIASGLRIKNLIGFKPYERKVVAPDQSHSVAILAIKG